MLRFSSVAACAVFVVTASLCAPPANAGEMTLKQEAHQTLRDIQVLASNVADQATHLQHYIGDNAIGFEAHRDRLMTLRTDVNRMGEQISQLHAERASLAPWERQAVDKVLPLLQATANNTEAATKTFNAHPNALWTADYRDPVDAIANNATEASQTLHEYLKLQDAKREVRQLSRDINVTGR